MVCGSEADRSRRMSRANVPDRSGFRFDRIRAHSGFLDRTRFRTVKTLPRPGEVTGREPAVASAWTGGRPSRIAIFGLAPVVEVPMPGTPASVIEGGEESRTFVPIATATGREPPIGRSGPDPADEDTMAEPPVLRRSNGRVRIGHAQRASPVPSCGSRLPVADQRLLDFEAVFRFVRCPWTGARSSCEDFGSQTSIAFCSVRRWDSTILAE